jgi:hypothetical protein
MVGYDAAVKLNHLKVKGRLVSERTKVANQKASARRRLRMSLLWKGSRRISTHRGCKLLNAVGPLARDRQQH